MTDNLHTTAGKKLLSGIRKVSQVVGKTMGTRGSNVLIESIERPHHYTTNDGFTIANSIKLGDPIEELGRNILLEAINRANKSSGDGSSTTCVLTDAILVEGLKKEFSTMSPMDIKRSLDGSIPEIEEKIRSKSKTITPLGVKAVASISAEDEDIGSRIAEIYEKIGTKGIIYWDTSKTPEDSYTIGTGITVDGAVYASPYMCDITETGLSNEVRWSNPSVLLIRQKLTGAQELNNIFEQLYNRNVRELVIFASDFEVPVIGDLIRTRIAKGFKSVVVKMPTLWADEWWEDLAKASGATIIDPVIGTPLNQARIDHAGTFGFIRITKEATYIDGIQDLSEHIKAIEIDNPLRASRLNTKTARYYVGAHSESALAFRRLKVEDAINAASCALESGVVAGGGVALASVAQELNNKILQKALLAPLNNIIANANFKSDVDLKKLAKENKGIDTRTLEVVDMFEAGIVDPVSVVLNAVRNAVSVAGTVLTTKSIVLLPRELEEAKNKQALLV